MYNGNMRKFLFVLIITLLLASCSISESSSWYSLKNGKLNCTLNGNPTTGYLWSCKVEDESVLFCSQEEYVAKPANGMVGVGGYWTYEFLVKTEGKTKVIFSYARPWENEAIEKRTLQIECSSSKIIKVTEF